MLTPLGNTKGLLIQKLAECPNLRLLYSAAWMLGFTVNGLKPPI